MYIHLKVVFYSCNIGEYNHTTKSIKKIDIIENKIDWSPVARVRECHKVTVAKDSSWLHMAHTCVSRGGDTAPMTPLDSDFMAVNTFMTTNMT